MINPKVLSDEEVAEAARVTKDLLIDVQSVAFDRATTYTTVIIFGAYAALFTVWTQAKDVLSGTATAWTAILLGTSVMAFVAFEVFKMLVTSRHFWRVRDLLVNNHAPKVLLQKREALARDQNLFVQRVVLPVWIFILIVSIVTGFGAAFLLLGTFFSELVVPSL